MKSKRRQPFALLGVISAAALLCGLSAVGASAASSGRTSTATSKEWTVTESVARTVVQAGTSIAATITIDNKTAHKLSGTGCPGVNFKMGVGSAQIPNPIGETLALCGYSIIPGVHVFHTKVITTYQTCGGGGTPKCGKPPRLTALPAGTYHTQILWPELGNNFPKPQQFTVTLTS